MPLAYRHEFRQGLFALWRTDESDAVLETFCTPEERSYAAEHFPATGRRREWLAWHALLHAVSGARHTGYSEQGAPVLDSGCISVSHTREFCAVLLGNAPCGMDIERVSRDFSKAAPRFLSPGERALAPDDALHPCRIWCAKEALYKWGGTNGADLLADIRITRWDAASGTMTGRIADKTCRVRLMQWQGLCIACCPE